jgi:hypothetical protein
MLMPQMSTQVWRHSRTGSTIKKLMTPAINNVLDVCVNFTNSWRPLVAGYRGSSTTKSRCSDPSKRIIHSTHNAASLACPGCLAW